jgi:hypothetical protein
MAAVKLWSSLIAAARTKINTNNKWKYMNLNPKTPQIHGTVKLHIPIKPI